MSERSEQPGLPFEVGSARERRLWDGLGRLRQVEPPARLRSAFYARLGSLSPPARGWWSALSYWLSHPLVPAAAMLLIGVLVGRALERPAGADDLNALRQEVALLHRDVALSLMNSQSAAERLKGVIGAAELTTVDPGVTRALLRQAGHDPNRAVRTAAIDALGPTVQAPDVGAEVMRLLRESASPLVQKALVDLILRHGDLAQLNALIKLSHDRGLHPDLVAYVNAALRGIGT